MSKWYQGEGKNSDVVLYSRVRLARNLADSPFPNRMNKDIRRTVSKKIYATIKSSDLANEFDMINLADVSKAKAFSYAEKQLISNEFAKSREQSSFMLSKDESVSIMLCEEDHIKINSFAAGQDLNEAYKKANKLDDIFIYGLHLAYTDNLGFLTSSPINLGTGLKASFALHLPALSQKNALYRLSSMVGKLGLSLRELYPNGAGDIYVLSNQVSLGISEKSAIDNVNAICDQIVKQERAAREELKENIDFEDKIYRTLGILKSARRLELNEFLDNLSLVRLGISLGYFDLEYKVIGDMLYTLQNATLLDSAQADLTELMCAKLRAQIVREKLE
ncbi:MAG: ATP--guanido phosphotransferase [Eubacterium sp.]